MPLQHSQITRASKIIGKNHTKLAKMSPKMILASTIKCNDIIVNHITVYDVNAIEKFNTDFSTFQKQVNVFQIQIQYQS